MSNPHPAAGGRDAAAQARHEFRVAAFVLLTIVLLLVAVGLLIWTFGPSVLGPIGLTATALVFMALLAYAAGF